MEIIRLPSHSNEHGDLQRGKCSSTLLWARRGWYLDRPGFWHGACGPAACWAGGVAGLLDNAMLDTRRDAHTLAHLAAMHANVWALVSYLEVAGSEIDAMPSDRHAAQIRALQIRHLVEQLCTDTVRRFARAYGPARLSLWMQTYRDGTKKRTYMSVSRTPNAILNRLPNF